MKAHNLIASVALVLSSVAFLAASPAKAQDDNTFDAQETVIVHKTAPSDPEHRHTFHLGIDETKVIYSEPTSAHPRWYFYLPPEAASVAQLIIQRRDGQLTFMLRGIGRGETVGGFVLEEWLDDSGFAPKSPLDESRIQHAVKTHPIYIRVR